MNLYSTKLLFRKTVISYQVYKEGERLFYKPINVLKGVDAPIFWVSKSAGEWKPMNIEDENFIMEIQKDIASHHAVVEDSD